MKILLIVVTLICIIRTVSYGIYTFEKKNTAGGISLLMISLLTIATGAVYFINNL